MAKQVRFDFKESQGSQLGGISVVRLQMVKESVLFCGPQVINSPAEAAALFRNYLQGADREHFIVATLSTKRHVQALHTVSIGSLSETSAHPREVYKLAILSNAAAILVAHNHPSGDPTPSLVDLEVTKRLQSAGEILGIELLDHIVLGDGTRYVSLKNMGRL